ncbi:RNA-binding S4 domain-containing protein [Aquamicrobium sp. LC103]|uniref:RNA-binding S4 domain-containing protein n=1 Tax=Aquamicrobium sp. LC103 TaxID=1120658 RepID=UPI00063EC90D|nr:RNA-binding S4 domain-containing protein [Aquamicrobium sp. LC103]TKT75450.1 RNA-binding S4 domain-containing protein [Aquamicrobium sp. LC103]
MAGEGRQRIDKWLFFARVVKSRSLAAKFVQAGRVRINRDKTDHPSQTVKPGDVLTITLERRVIVYRVVDCGARRGPAEEARTLYEDLTPPPAPSGQALPDALAPVRKAGSGRPTKRERRDLDAWRGGDDGGNGE